MLSARRYKGSRGGSSGSNAVTPPPSRSPITPSKERLTEQEPSSITGTLPG